MALIIIPQKKTYLVHSSIFVDVKKMFFNPIDGWDYKLLADGTIFDMKLIEHTRETSDLLNDLMNDAAFSFPWMSQPTLYMDLKFFFILERFIEINNFHKFIVKVETKQGISAPKILIKVITFNKRLRRQLDIAYNFGSYIRKTIGKLKRPKFYYIIEDDFQPWYQSPELKHFNISVDKQNLNTICSVFPIVFDHLSILRTSFNVLDLISVKLAFHDFRQPLPETNHLNAEIDYHIHRLLHQTISTNSVLDKRRYFPQQYEVEYKRKALEIQTAYFDYAYADMLWNTAKTKSINLKEIKEVNVVDIVKTMFNVVILIDGMGFGKMDTTLFWKLFACPNVVQIMLDTKYRWRAVDNPEKCSIPIRAIESIWKCEIYLTGSNKFNFVDSFVASLKSHKHNRDLVLRVQCNLQDYMLFYDLKVKKIIFDQIEIDSALIEYLNYFILCGPCKGHIFPQIIAFQNCTIGSPENWEICNLRSNDDLAFIIERIQIRENERTWQTMLKYVYNKLTDSDLKYFKFVRETFICLGYKSIPIKLHELKFTIDVMNSKLDIVDLNNNIVDLYFFNNRLSTDSDSHCSDYEFYQ